MPDANSTNCLTTLSVRIIARIIQCCDSKLGTASVSRSGQQQMADWQVDHWLFQLFPVLEILAWRQLPRLPTVRTLCCTFTRSAAANIKAKIRKYLRGLSLPPGGFVVHTSTGLHSISPLATHLGCRQCYINHAKPKSPINPYLRSSGLPTIHALFPAPGRSSI